MDCRHSSLFTCNMCEKNENKLVDKTQKIEERLTRLEQIDEQTRMFWNLQLQFLEMSTEGLISIAFDNWSKFGGKKPQLIYRLVKNEELATELALQLSGLK